MIEDGPPHPAGRELDPKVESYCWWHNEIESIPKNVYIICFECGHVWTKKTLRQAYRREYDGPKLAWRNEKIVTDYTYFGPDVANPYRWARHHWYRLTKRANKIYFCQACIHDF